MKYLLHDLIKLPLSDRLVLIEKIINSARIAEELPGGQHFKPAANYSLLEQYNEVNS